MTRHTWTREEAQAALAAMPPPGSMDDALWHGRTPGSLAACVFRRMPETLEGIAKLLIGVTTGSQD